MLNRNEIIKFWSGIMRDHTDFILMNLSSKEMEMVEQAKYFKQQFNEININVVDSNYMYDIKKLIMDFINFKCLILKKLLTCVIEFNLLPTFVNHMINEAMEFYNDLEKSERQLQIDIVNENIVLHKIWLADTAGHARSIAAFLDPIEQLEIKEANEFGDTFDSLLIKADELGKMLERTELDSNQLLYLNEQVILNVIKFINFLSKIKELSCQCKLLGIIKPIVPDHMIREANYYLDNIEMYSNKTY